jgi:O-antigen chain-terminating methyltransferase
MANDINVQTIMQEIRERIRQRSTPPPLPAEPEFPSNPELPDLNPLETTVRSLHLSKALVGDLPPQPPSFRGRLGSLLVKAVRRTLFWYTPPIRDFQAGVVVGFDQQVAALRSMAAAAQDTWRVLMEVENRCQIIEERFAKLEQALHLELENRGAKLEHSLHAEARAREYLGERLEAETAAREQLSSHLAAETGAREAMSSSIAERSRQLDIAIQQLRAENSHQHARISILLEEVRKKAAVSGEPQAAQLSGGDSHALDGLYMALEDRFRGSRAEIRERLQFYLPLLEKHRIGNPRMPILDLGCGRGEWLEILTETGLEAYGVDTNQIFVAQCREKGFRVIEEDALQHLRSLPDSRLGAVTGFHIIEHLPLDVLIKLIDETVRVLKPGGLAIFETPNPQNVLVGSNNFYIDPTHHRPVPCLTAQFLLEARGLCDVEIVGLHPFAESYHVLDGTELARRFNEYFYGPQDYAVIGRRV